VEPQLGGGVERPQDGGLSGGPIQDGTRLSFVVTTEYNWAIGLANQSWTLQKKGSTHIAAYVDQKFIASGKAWHFDNRVAFLLLTGAEAYHALQKGQRLELQTPYGSNATGEVSANMMYDPIIDRHSG
jgi:hypothetical protein